jgi:hypothetical protein
MQSPQHNEHPSAGLGGSGQEKSIAVPPAYSIKYLIVTVLLSISPLICALYYQQTKLNKQEKAYIELLDKLNNKKNLTKQEVEIVKQITGKPDVEPPKTNKKKSNKIRPSFNNRF